MEFMGIGLPELLVILVIGLLVVGPKRLPEMAAQLGRFMRAFQRYSSQVTREFGDTMRELEREYDETKGDWKAVGQGLDETAASVKQDINGLGQDASISTGARPPTADGPQVIGPPR
jgi:Tat protein translocase TatB subunit